MAMVASARGGLAVTLPLVLFHARSYVESDRHQVATDGDISVFFKGSLSSALRWLREGVVGGRRNTPIHRVCLKRCNGPSSNPVPVSPADPLEEVEEASYLLQLYEDEWSPAISCGRLDFDSLKHFQGAFAFVLYDRGCVGAAGCGVRLTECLGECWASSAMGSAQFM